MNGNAKRTAFPIDSKGKADREIAQNRRLPKVDYRRHDLQALENLKGTMKNLKGSRISYLLSPEASASAKGSPLPSQLLALAALSFVW